MVIDSLQYDEPRTGSISVITLLELLRGVSDWLRSRGETIPEADVIIAATAISRGVELKTRDEHFARLVGYGLKLKGR